jgi:hypothetical protein
MDGDSIGGDKFGLGAIAESLAAVGTGNTVITTSEAHLRALLDLGLKIDSLADDQRAMRAAQNQGAETLAQLTSTLVELRQMTTRAFGLLDNRQTSGERRIALTEAAHTDLAARITGIERGLDRVDQRSARAEALLVWIALGAALIGSLLGSLIDALLRHL